MNLIKLALTMALLLLGNCAHATNYQYISDPDMGIHITSLNFEVPHRYTGRLMDITAASWVYGKDIPNGIITYNITTASHGFHYSNFNYVNPSENIDFWLSFYDVVFWNPDNYFDFVDGKIVSWSLHPMSFRDINKNVILNSSLGGSWVVAQVPEPSTYAMITLGLSLISFASRHRKTS